MAASTCFREHMLNRKFVARHQRRHVLLCNLLPFVGTVIAICLAFVHPVGWLEISLLALMWFLTIGVGMSIGFHRYFSHHAFETSRPIRGALAILGSMAALGSPLSWATIHRRHHEHSDGPGDPHTPHQHGSTLTGKLHGFWHAYFAWMVSHDIPDPTHYAPDLLRDQQISRLSRRYYLWVFLGVFIPGIVAGVITQSWWGLLMGVLWGGLLRIFVCAQCIYCVTFCHMIGSRPFDNRDQSKNIAVLAVPTFGESWHNNHHAYPTSARTGVKWWQLDPGYIVICVLERLSLIWNVKRPYVDREAT